jgi:uncharacterized membrane protein HdeD (DUF308 family)
MAGPAVTSQQGAQALGSSESRPQDMAAAAFDFWWLWLVTGILWILASLVILQFDGASITTVGVIFGCMFVFAGAQEVTAGALGGPLRWLRFTFGALFICAGIVAFINPEETFAGFADILGFLLLLVAVWWIVEALSVRGDNPVWWIGLISGLLMLAVAFWTSGQFFIEKAYTLLVFAGIWALLHGITDVMKAFAVRTLRDLV